MRVALLLAWLLVGSWLTGGAFGQTSRAKKPPVTIRFTVWDGDVALRTIRELCTRFESENPDIRIKLENYPDYTVYHQKMMITYAAGVAPDVAMMDPPNVQRLARRGALLPLEPFFARSPGFDIKAYYKESVEAHSDRGVCYVLPRDIAPMAIIYYNRRAFLDAGLGDPKTYDREWTWDAVPHPDKGHLDFLTVCEKLTKKEKGGRIVRWAYAPGWPGLTAEMAAFSMGGKYVDNPEDPTKILTREPAFLAGNQWVYDLITKWKYMPSSSEVSGALQSTTQQMFARGQVAMYQNGIWEVPNIRKALVPGNKEFFEWDICLAPAYLNPGGKPLLRCPTGGSGYAIFSSTAHPEEAWRVTRFFAGPAGMEAMARAGIAQPAIREMAITPGIWVPGPGTPVEQTYPANRIATDQAVLASFISMKWESGAALGDRFSKGMELSWSGMKPPGPTILENAALAEERLASIRRDDRLPLFNWWVGLAIGIVLVGGLITWIALPAKGSVKEAPSRLARAETRSAYLFLSPWLIGLALFTLGPMILSLLMAFADWDIIRAARFRGIGNFVEAFTADPSFYPSLWATFKYTILAVPLGMIGSLCLALLLNQKVRGVAFYRAMYYIPSIASAVAAALIWRRLFNPENGLVNAILYGGEGRMSWLGQMLSNWAGTPDKRLDWFGNEKSALLAIIIMSLWGVGGGMVIFLAGLQSIPQHYYEAATLDGAGVFKRFKTVTIPLLTPTIFFTLVTGLIGSLQVFTQAFVITAGGPNDSTRFYVYHLYMNAFGSVRMGYASALGWILFFIVMAFTYIQIRGSKWVYYEADAK